MSIEDRSWMCMAKYTAEWQKGFKDFIQNTFGGTSKEETAPCPCARCRCMSYRNQKDVRSHLVLRGFDESFIQGEGNAEDLVASPHEDRPAEGEYDDNEIGDAPASKELISALISGAIHGELTGSGDEEPYESAKQFFRLLTEAQKELYPGCKEATKISFVVRIFQMKCMHGFSNNGVQSILDLFALFHPGISDTLEKVRKIVRDLGLDYKKIHACVNDCVLFRGDYANLDTCPTCGESRWKGTDSSEDAESSSTCGGQRRFPRKILRYFPLTPRLQRLFMRKLTSTLMRWHNEGWMHDGKMRHPADSLAWKHLDAMEEKFASEPRNVRLGLASDGFNPFGMLNVAYTTWPVILIPYNLPPWLCLKQSYWIMSMLIPRPKSPGMNIDVYLQPLIDELKDLWKDGAWTWDATVRKSFTLRAVLLWTINDFNAYAMLSGWSTKGKFTCPYCHKFTEYLWLKFGCKHCYLGHRRFLPQNHRWSRNKSSFNNKVETREAPVPLAGEEVRQEYDSFEQPKFGQGTRKRKQREDDFSVSMSHNFIR